MRTLFHTHAGLQCLHYFTLVYIVYTNLHYFTLVYNVYTILHYFTLVHAVINVHFCISSCPGISLHTLGLRQKDKKTERQKI